ncbi:hypothetical protein VTH82DRAFT_2543 [Thermothelomyces myriococcoides]
MRRTVLHTPTCHLGVQDGLPNFQPVAMCDFTKNYYIYTSCADPGAHFFRTSLDGNRAHSCPKGPHERYIMLPGECPMCHGG